MTTTMRTAARTETGLVRPTNEDAVFAGPELVAVADGMRGPAGRAASTAAVAALTAWPPDGDRLEALPGALNAAVRAVREIDQDDAVSTLTALLWLGSDRLALVHIGDTRAYVLRHGDLLQLTPDHTYVQSLVDAGTLTPQEAATHPQRALLVRALTRHGSDRPDLSTREACPGDRYLLASDGLTTVVSKSELRDMLAEAAEPAQAVDALVDAAYRAGAPDNIACAVADIAIDPATGPSSTGRAGPARIGA